MIEIVAAASCGGVRKVVVVRSLHVKQMESESCYGRAVASSSFLLLAMP